MGNSSSKDETPRLHRPEAGRHASTRSHHSAHQVSAPAVSSNEQTPADRLATHIQNVYGSRNGSGRNSRSDLAFLAAIGRERREEAAQPERVRETRQEREARKIERERQARVKERERSIREEGVDGGFLVTLGTYTGPEDFNKNVVRQLQLERRLAPFWKGLNDHSDSWTEAQLVAAVRGLPIPAADEIPADLDRTGSMTSSNPRSSDVNINTLTVPITARSQSYQSENSANLSASHPAFSSLATSSPPASPTSPTSPTGTTTSVLRGRAKTLASLATGGSKTHSPDMTPREIQLPKDPYVNGLPIEAYLYKEVVECPICFLYYPPYLNRTRCCDQPICSECFVQIKRPDPHPPEHEQPGQPRPPEEEAEMLVSEPSACPFCVTPEFGVTYEPPPFRRGLGYANQANGHPLKNLNSAMSSSSSLTSAGGRRRATSLSANSPNVITTDRVRPDWAKKLADARAHALRRSAAATALHNAAYMLGAQGEGQLRGMAFARRRRTLFGDSPGGSGSGTPRIAEDGSTPDLIGARTSSRRPGASRLDDLEELMMMEAIRLSIAAEEERQKREEKEARKEEKKKAKDEKKQQKMTRRFRSGSASTVGGELYPASMNASAASTASWAGGSSVGMARSSSNLGMSAGPHPSIPEEQGHVEVQGKGKAPLTSASSSAPHAASSIDGADFAATFDPLAESPPARAADNTRNDSPSPGTSSSLNHLINPIEDPQRHLEASRANLQPFTGSPIPSPGTASPHFRHLSNTSSPASSFIERSPLAGGSLGVPGTASDGFSDATPDDENVTPMLGTTPLATEPMFNFRSLAAMIGEEQQQAVGEGVVEGDKKEEGSEFVEHAGVSSPPQEARDNEAEAPKTNLSAQVAAAVAQPKLEDLDSPPRNSNSAAPLTRGDSDESSGTSPPPLYVEHAPKSTGITPTNDGDVIEPAPPVVEALHAAAPQHDIDKKEVGGVEMFSSRHVHLH